ncbi:hypothetical protein E2C01_015715 [Portunus trituberculatus]|uniref:Uncharacterized protein n=1 Tax=Portunus trituberculatus TaxID=210409 RepID=A0A5B7DNU1_PORTR|nr:hypothetical protein [Portunus trituberculatus]
MFSAAAKRRRGDEGPEEVNMGAADASAADDDFAASTRTSNNNTLRYRSISLPGVTHHGDSSRASTSSMTLLSPTSHTRPDDTDPRSAPTSPARMPAPEGAKAQEPVQAFYKPNNPYLRMYVAGSNIPMVMYPRGSTVTQVRFKPSKDQ